jgi:translation initiation factor IF-3
MASLVALADIGCDCRGIAASVASTARPSHIPYARLPKPFISGAFDGKASANINLGVLTIATPPTRRAMTPPVKSGPRFNNLITAEKVRVIDDDGENLGVLYTREAIAQAAEVGLDLVEVSPNADPPVCKFLDIGKFKYEAQKKANLARKSQKTQEIKEIKMRPNIDDHDYMVKMKKVAEFIDEGDKVKITLRFRGRELAHQQLGMNLLQRVQADTAETAKVEAYPRMEGRQMLMVLSPK